MSEVKSFKDLGIAAPEITALEGSKIEIIKLFGREIIVHRYEIHPSRLKDTPPGSMCLWMQITLDGNKRVVFSGSSYLQKVIKQIPPDGFPFRTRIEKKDNDSHQFT